MASADPNHLFFVRFPLPAVKGAGTTAENRLGWVFSGEERNPVIVNVAGRLPAMAKTMPDAVAVVEPRGYGRSESRDTIAVTSREQPGTIAASRLPNWIATATASPADFAMGVPRARGWPCWSGRASTSSPWSSPLQGRRGGDPHRPGHGHAEPDRLPGRGPSRKDSSPFPSAQAVRHSARRFPRPGLT